MGREVLRWKGLVLEEGPDDATETSNRTFFFGGGDDDE